MRTPLIPTRDPLTYVVATITGPDAGVTTADLTLDNDGVLSWPTAGVTLGDYEITLAVSDDGTPVLTDTQVFTVSVTETNANNRRTDNRQHPSRRRPNRRAIIARCAGVGPRQRPARVIL